MQMPESLSAYLENDLVIKLVACESSAALEDILIHEFPTSIGRSDESDITVGDKWLSRQHCQIQLNADRFSVRDLQSKHGTYLNDEPVTDAELKNGDDLRIGLTRFHIQIVRG